jgi:hypothetical protein
VRGVSALSRAMRGADPSKVSIVVIWEPVLRSDRKAPGRSVTSRLGDVQAARFWDPQRIASQAAVRTALAHPERLPEAMRVDESFIVWDVVATWPPGARWDASLPWPEWFDDPVVDAESELARRIASCAGRGAASGHATP